MAYVLFILFLTLKLCSVIDWSWWWVTAPLWGLFILLCINAAMESDETRIRRRLRR